MKLKRLIFSMSAVFCLTLSMTVCANALEYNVDSVENAEYYPATDYDTVYGAQYSYGETNAIDFDIPNLPYGVSSNASIGPMEKAHLPGMNLSSNNTNLDGIDNTGLYRPVVPEAPVYHPPAYTSTTNMARSDGSIGTLKIPSLNISMRVWEGETNASMSKGLGHYTSTSGWDGNVGVCGHNRGSKYVIGSVKDLEIGDTMTYTTIYGARTYEVSFVGVISSTDWSYLQLTADNRITITTCVSNQPDYRLCVQAIEVKR